MKSKLPVIIFLILVLIFLFPTPSMGIEFSVCKDCHGKIKPIPQNSLTKDCTVCHNRHGSGSDQAPKIRIPERVHDIHGNIGKQSDRKDCQECHRDYPIECERCHNSHENTGSVKTRTSIINMSACTGCHGKLPQPGGHSDFRSALSDSKHMWMNCRTCHVNVAKDISASNGETNNGTNGSKNDYGFKLHFKDLSVISISDSINLCKICHSLQYGESKEGTHGDVNKVCIDCHNPHTTKFGAMVRITPKETQKNMSTEIESATDWITTKVPILKNTTVLYIIIIIIFATVGEFILSKDEEGKKTAYNTVKIHENEDTLKTLEVRSKCQNADIVDKILITSDIDILGMTMTIEEDKGVKIYKYVIFVNIEKPTDENDIVSKIANADNVINAIFTDRYEL